MNKKFWITAIFWGSCWGLAEASLGYALHIVPAISASIMFPIGFFCMRRSVITSGSTASIWLVSLVAATIKLSDLALPYHHISSIINPALCILLEAGATFVLLKLLDKQKQPILSIASAAVLWRVLFLAWQQVSPFTQGLGKQITQPELLLRLSIGVVLNTLILFSFLKIEKKELFQEKIERIKIGKIAAISTCVLALTTEMIFRSL